MSRRAIAPLLALGLTAVLSAACGGKAAEPQRWISLAELYRPAPLTERVRARIARTEAGPELTVFDEEGEPRVDLRIPAQAWQRDDQLRWWTEPAHEILAFARPERGRLRLDGKRAGRVQSLTPRPPPTEAVFHFDAGRITVFGPGTDAAPRDAVFSVGIDEGVRMDGTHWVVTRGLFGAGFALWPDEEVELELPPFTASTLRFVPVLRGTTGPEPTVLCVRLDGEVLRELELLGDERPFIEIPLPRDAPAGARLSFEATGPPRLTVIYRPVVGPSVLGRPGARPWSSGPDDRSRPDLVLFLADTLRADSLAAYGGDPDVAPHLNRLAERSRRYAGVRATASWTLPSVASILTGVYPPEHGVERSDQGLGPDWLTIAELLRQRGYRTAAVTDSFFVSRRHGFQQGFEWFEEIKHGEWNLPRTLATARELLERDDGRPLFLLVHTYRVHKPYRAGPGEDDADYRRLLAEVGKQVAGDPRAAEAALRARAPELAAMYVDGVRGLDAVAGPWLADLADSELLANGVLILTSDHGEAFDEHGELFHRGPLWDEVVRVPLLIHAPDLAVVEPGRDPRNASLVDLFPTLTGLAGISTPAGGSGRSLLGPPSERPVFAFLTRDETATESAVIQDGKKLMLSPESRLTAAFDLARDPGEAADLGRDPGCARCSTVAPEESTSPAARIDALPSPSSDTPTNEEPRSHPGRAPGARTPLRVRRVRRLRRGAAALDPAGGGF